MDIRTEPVVTSPTPAEARCLLPQLLQNLPRAEQTEKLRWLLPALETLPNAVGEANPTTGIPTPPSPPIARNAASETPAATGTPVVSKTPAISDLAAARQYLSGLFLARASPAAPPAAVIWVHPAPGATALVAAPLTVKPGATLAVCHETPVAELWQMRLLQRAVGWAADQGVEMLQAVAQPEDTRFQTALSQAGVAPLVDLVFVASPPLDSAALSPAAAASAPDPTPGQLETRFHCLPPTKDHLHRWYRLLEATYVDSLDCPAINGRRSLAQTVAGYQATGQCWEPGWVVLTSASGDDLGGLILADHPADDFLELIYFGVVPQARGCGLGRRILQQALQLAALAGRSRLIAAVDRRNLPALRVYAAADFTALEQRAVFARFFTPKSSSSDTEPKIR